ncbi:MAG: PAS domain S-box protein [Myxococcales bacterium]|nr:PAS domain S-box protein [Myxococcales bacterium]MDH3484881.1 PAS domain S-box protein [Myxococcales bacterium]
MKAPRVPKNEVDRLKALDGYRVMDTPPEDAFDGLTTLVARILNVPIALVSLVDADRQWFKSRYGLDAPETPRDVSFCGHVVAEQELLVVPDAFEDDRFHDNPLVTGDPRVRFYAGYPLTTPDGHVLGTLCAIDHKARRITDQQLDTLKILGRQAADQLELRRQLLISKDYEQLFDNSNVLPAIADFNGFFERINRRWTEALGHSEEELLSRPFIEFVHEDDVASTQEAAARLGEASSEVAQFTNRYRCADGSYRWLLWHATSDLESNRIYAVAHDDTSRKEAENRMRDALASLADSEERLRTVFETAVDAIVTIDEGGVIDRVNAVVRQLFGYEPAELVGQHIGILMPPRHREPLEQYLQDYPNDPAAKSVASSQEAVAVRKDGTTFPVEMSVSEMRLGERRMFTGIVRDITERKRIEQLKSEFVSTVSHELRTPLTSIRGALGLLAGGRIGEMSTEASEMVNIALNNSERLVRLINDILDVEKIRSGKLDFQIQELDLSEVVTEAVEANQGFAVAHNTSIVHAGDLQSVQVHADRDRLAQILANLLSNAAKFSPEGQPIEISMDITADRVRVEVGDRGPGVPEEFREQLFERFTQADASDSRRNTGTGLGLSIAKAIVERMGGTIGYEPGKDSGSRFYFELPVAKPALLDERAEAARILVCEDEADIALLLKKILGIQGYLVDVAPNITTATALLSERDYAAVTLDLKLGQEDGRNLLEEIRNTAGSIPVVVVSAIADEASQKVNGGAVSVVDWITKPIDETRLLESIRSATRTASRNRLLHVEDDTDLSMMLSAFLSDVGTLINVRTLREAREHLHRETYDLILLDMGLPDGDGTELLPFVGNTPVIVFSAREANSVASEKIVAALVKSRATEQALREAINSALPDAP